MAQIINELDKLTADKHILLSALIELTHACNLDCFHCYNTPLRKKELGAAEWKKLLLDLSRTGCLYLTFSGGEIFARKDFFDIAFYAKRRNFAISLFTNGSLIDSRTADRLQGLGLLDVGISLYASVPAQHDAITRCPGSFEKTLTAIRLLKQRKILTRIKCQLSKRNFEEFPHLIALAKKLGVAYEFDPILTPGRNDDTSILAERLSDRQVKILFSDERVFFADHDIRKLPKDYKLQILCTAGVTSCSISPYGEVFPCVQMRLKAGDITQTSITEIWENSPLFNTFRGIKNSDLTPCWECGLKTYCGRCPGIALAEDGDLMGISNVACRHARVVERIVKRSK